MNRVAMLLVLAGAMSLAQGRKNADPLPSVTSVGFHKLRLAYADGTAIDVYTQSSVMPLPASGKKQGAAWPGMLGTLVVWRDGVHRMVIDKDGAIVFGYDLAASAGRWPGTVTIRITPLGGGFEAALRKGAIEVLAVAGGTPGKVPVGPIPTVASVREFPSVSKDQAVIMDILYNPSTEERIFEVLIPSAAKSGEGKL